MRISGFGCGYLGSVHAACLTRLGHDVVGVDVLETQESNSPGANAVLRAGLPELLQQGLTTVVVQGSPSGWSTSRRTPRSLPVTARRPASSTAATAWTQPTGAARAGPTGRSGALSTGPSSCGTRAADRRQPPGNRGGRSSSATVGAPELGSPCSLRSTPQISGTHDDHRQADDGDQHRVGVVLAGAERRPAGLVEQRDAGHRQHHDDAAADERLRHPRRDLAAEDRARDGAEHQRDQDLPVEAVERRCWRSRRPAPAAPPARGRCRPASPRTARGRASAARS